MAVVADDIDLGVTHVIRGDDHVNNTPRQILIYKAMEEPRPQYAHVPMILGPDKARLSKRHGAMSVLAYRDMGYLPHALLNALARLGWSYGDQEKFTREELVEKFSLDNVGKAAGVFNAEKLLDLNAWYIRESADATLSQAVLPFLRKLGLEDPDRERLAKAVGTVKPRSKTLQDMAERAAFYFQDTIEYESAGDEKFLTPEVLPWMEDLRARLGETPAFDEKSLEEVFQSYLEHHNIPLKRIAQPLRVALTGKTASPGLFEVMDVLGKSAVLKRLDQAIAHIRSKT
jgi:glutamyl-tRNA synthetase